MLSRLPGANLYSTINIEIVMTLNNFKMTLVLIVNCASSVLWADDQARPNVVIILVDDFGWADPSCYGNTAVQTPNIDRMAKQGIRFTQGYVASRSALHRGAA